MADQKQWPEELEIARNPGGGPFITERGRTHYEQETYVPKAALEAERERREEAERAAAETRRLFKVDTLNAYEAAARREANRAQKAEASLASERERVKAVVERLRNEVEGERVQVLCDNLEAALSPSPVEGEECERCGGSGKKTHVGTVGHRVTVACSHCHGTGRKRPDPAATYDQLETVDPETDPRFGGQPDPEERREERLILSDEGLAGLLDPDSFDDEAERTVSMKSRLWGACQDFSGRAVELILRPAVPDSNKEADRATD